MGLPLGGLAAFRAVCARLRRDDDGSDRFSAIAAHSDGGVLAIVVGMLSVIVIEAVLLSACEG